MRSRLRNKPLKRAMRRLRLCSLPSRKWHKTLPPRQKTPPSNRTL